LFVPSRSGLVDFVSVEIGFHPPSGLGTYRPTVGQVPSPSDSDRSSSSFTGRLGRSDLQSSPSGFSDSLRRREVNMSILLRDRSRTLGVDKLRSGLLSELVREVLVFFRRPGLRFLECWTRLGRRLVVVR